MDIDNALRRAGVDAAVALAECTLLAAFDDLICTGLVAGSHALLVQMLELVERVEVVLVIGVRQELRIVLHHHLDVAIGLEPGRIALLCILRQEALLMDKLADLGHEVFARRLVVHVGEPAIVVEAEVDRLEVIPVDAEQTAGGAHDVFRLIADVQDPLVIREFAAQRLCDDCCRIRVVQAPGIGRILANGMDCVNHVANGAHAVRHAAGTDRLLADDAMIEAGVLVRPAALESAGAHLHEDEVHVCVGGLLIRGVADLCIRIHLAEQDLSELAHRLLTRTIDIEEDQPAEREVLLEPHEALEEARRIGASATDDAYVVTLLCHCIHLSDRFEQACRCPADSHIRAGTGGFFPLFPARTMKIAPRESPRRAWSCYRNSCHNLLHVSESETHSCSLGPRGEQNICQMPLHQASHQQSLSCCAISSPMPRRYLT